MQKPKRIAVLFAVYTAFCAAVTGFVFLNQLSDQAYLQALEAAKSKQGSGDEVKLVEVTAETETVVVARREIAYGSKLRAADLQLIEWPKDKVPENAFTSMADVFKNAAIGDRFTLAAMVTNEVVLPKKISEPGRRATLAALLRKDTRAVAVDVDAVLGVAGFVRPGDFVDVLMTRSIDNGDKDEHYTVVLLQQVHVLGVDQTSRVTSDVSDVVKKAPKTVTLEVDLVGAQKLALSRSIGRLSLALRRPRGPIVAGVPRISIADLAHGGQSVTQGTVQLASHNSGPATPKSPVVQPKKLTKTIAVYRAVERSEAQVVEEKVGDDALPADDTSADVTPSGPKRVSVSGSDS
ncbi:MAG: Flp pilus assembly protein CpaB [Pseudomonadota bacterium]